jgi:hypothetical protein
MRRDPTANPSLTEKPQPSPWRRLGLSVLLGVCAGCRGAPVPHPAANEPEVAPTAVAAASDAPKPGAGARLGAAGGTALGAKADDAAPKIRAVSAGAKQNDSAKADVTPVRIRAEGQLGPGKNTLFIDIAPPEGAKLTLESPLNVRGSGGIGLEFPRRLSGPLSTHPMPLRLPVDVTEGATGPARVELTYYWCTDGNEAACRREQAHLDVELDLSGASAGGEAHLSYRARDKS